MPALVDLTGKTFGLLTVLERVENSANGKARWLCQCACGNLHPVIGNHLQSSNTKSCGCTTNNRTHGMSGTKAYNSWKSMLARCYNPKHEAYSRYADNGITVCDRWRHSVKAFRTDMGDPPFEGASIDRINNEDGYYPENCRWATRVQQGNNKRNNRLISFCGVTKPLAQWAKETGLSYSCLHSRVFKHGWPIEKALSTPVQKRRTK